MDIRSRESWNASKPTSVSYMVQRRDRIFVHWLGTAYDSNLSDEEILQRVQNYHQGAKDWSDIGYSWAIGRNGVYTCRGMNVAGGHTAGENFDSYGVVFLIGEGQEPTRQMWLWFSELVEWLRLNDPLFNNDMDGRVYGHRHDEEASTECPGDTLASLAVEYTHSRDYPLLAEEAEGDSLVESLETVIRALQLIVARELRK